jgi:hypothetical protein
MGGWWKKELSRRLNKVLDKAVGIFTHLNQTSPYVLVE